MEEFLFSEKGLFYRKNEYLESRKTLVFVHGISGSSSAFIKYEDKFKDKYNILSFDMKGHGKSKKSYKYTDYKISKLADDMKKLLEYLNIKNPIIISHSFGTLVTLEYISKYQQEVRAVVFLSPNYSLNKSFISKFIKKILFFVPVLSFLKFDNKYGKHIDYSKYQNTHDWNIRRSFADIKNTFLRVYLYCLKQAHEVSYEKELDSIKIPTLIVHGLKDSIFSLKDAVFISEKISNSKISIIDSDHIIVLNNFKEVSENIEKFVKMV